MCTTFFANTVTFIFTMLLISCPQGTEVLRAQGRISESTLPLPTQRLINDMATDPQGFLWIATRNGLYRHDGHRYVAYNNAAGTSNRISQNEVLEIFPASDGNLVLYNHKHKVDILDPTTNTLKTIDLSSKTSPGGDIRTGCIQPDGRIFFITEHDKGYTLFEYSDGGFIKRFDRQENRSTNPKMTAAGSRRFHMVLLADESFLLYDQENGLLHLSRNGELIRRISSEKDMSQYKVLNFLKQENQEVLLAYNSVKGVYRVDLSSGNILPDLRFPETHFYNFCREDENGNYLFGISENGPQIQSFLILEKEGRLSEIDNSDSKTINNNFAYGRNFTDFFYSVSTNGLIKIKTGLRYIKSYMAGQNISMRGIIEDDYGNLIVATEWDGWFRLDIKSGKIAPVKMDNLKVKDLNPPQFARNLLKDKNGDIWISAYGNPPVTSTPDGYMLQYRPSDGSIKVYKNKFRIEAILLSKSGHFYVASDGVLQSFDPITEQFNDIPGNYGSLSSKSVIPNCIMQTRDGLVWIGAENGLIRFDYTNQSFMFFGEDAINDVQFSNNNIMAIHEDTEGLLWLGTQGGLNVFDPVAAKVKVYTTKNGLPDNNICGLMPNDNGGLWISTYKGLSYLNPEKTQFRNFYTSDGFNHNEFNRHSFYRTNDGTYFLGGMDGFNAFRAEELLKEKSSLKILLSEISYFDAKGDSLITLAHGLNQFSSVTLPASNRYLQLRFGLDNYSHPEQNSYSVFLEGYDTDWISQGNVAEVRYNNLPPGTYRLHVKGTGTSGTISENMLVLDIRVKDFFYKSLWFYLLLFLAGSGLAALWIIRLRTEKNRLTFEVEKRTAQIRSDRDTIEKQARELQTLDRMKSRFFANISHELRTPLTLILGPLKRILAKDKLEIPVVRQHLELMKKNGELLQHHIEELLELSRLDAGKAILRENSVDLKFCVQQIVDRFKQAAVQKNIGLFLEWQLDFTEPVLLDRSTFEKILGNLISNAVKFTSAGEVKIHVFNKTSPSPHGAESLLNILVTDTGKGISSQDLPRIFDRYFQAQNDLSFSEGTGIGLSMAKEFAELMGGTLSAESQPEVGSNFTLVLPVKKPDYQTYGYEEADNEQFPQENLSGNGAIPKPETEGKKEFTVLMAEDNPDLRNFLQQILDTRYNVVAVENGKQALEYLIQNESSIRNHIVLSDVMMPEMDGFILLDTVRSKETLRRIPFIMLTAKAGGENRIRALRMGVDDYLLKPFDEEELLVRIANLLSNLSMRQQAEVEIKDHTEEEYAVGAEWLEILENRALESLSDPQMGMDLLAEKLELSRSSLHRRIKAETGLTPNMYLREIRLQEARRLLENRLVVSVAEAGQRVGIQKRAYFSKLFFERFGRLPSSYTEDIDTAISE